MKEKLFISTLVIFYIISLFLPGLVFEPSSSENPKFGFCTRATKEDSNCRIDIDTNIYSCGKWIKDPTSKEEILSYCGTDWSEPKATWYEGWRILLSGWAGIFILNFAWYANGFFFVSLFALYTKNYSDSFKFSLVAVLFALSAFTALGAEIPKNEGRVDDYIVDYLGLGYYVWLMVIVALTIYSYRRFNEGSTKNV